MPTHYPEKSQSMKKKKQIIPKFWRNLKKIKKKKEPERKQEL